MKTFDYSTYNNEPTANTLQGTRRDALWMMSNALQSDTPMWFEWNSLVTVDNLPQQTIQYLENIKLPITILDVVRETLKRLHQVAAECHQEGIIVHYDLAIAKPALQIQCTEVPRFDNVFICFGPFHIIMAYLACLGHLDRKF